MRSERPARRTRSGDVAWGRGPLPHPMWQDRLISARDFVVPWIKSHVDLAGATVVEYGCGQGAVTCALAPHVARHIGIDIDAEALAMAEGHVARLDVANAEFVHASVDSVVGSLRDVLPEADVVLLYAVLEHLTVDERLEVLRVCRDAMPAAASLVVCETPSRLTPFDVHTGQMPFLHQLPVELAARYATHSPRPDFSEAIEASGGPQSAERREAIARWGQGVSFHEFELVFGSLDGRVVAGGFDPCLYPIRPVREEEVELARRLGAWRPDLHPAWARCWLDLILRPTPGEVVEGAVGAARPWAMRTRQVESGVAMLPGPVLEVAPRAAASVRFPTTVQAVHVGARTTAMDGRAVAEVISRGVRHVVELQRPLDSGAPWHGVLDLPAPCSAVDLELPLGGNITYVGYVPEV